MKTRIFEICIENKKCTKCKKFKSYDCFHKERRIRSGLRSWCIQCSKKHTVSSSVCKLNLITPEEDFYIRESSNVCDICKSEMKIKCIDHCHKTNKIRGVLCNSCNSFLGFAKDDPIILRRGIKYLRDHSTQEETEPKRAKQLSLF